MGQGGHTMIFWLSIIIFAVSVAMLIANRIGESLSYEYEYSSVSGFILSFGVVISFISAVWFLVAGLILLLTKTNVTATRQANAEKYKALTYKLESEACRDQFGLLNKEIIDEVQRWNVKVTYYKAMEDNFWVGIYYPDVYGDLGTIDYETYEGN